MTTSIEALRAALGLAPDAKLIELASAPAPIDIDHARSTPSTAAEPWLLRGYDALPVPDEVPVVVSRPTAHADVVCVETPHLIVGVLGAVTHHQRDTYLDARTGPAVVQISDDERSWLVVAQADATRFFRIEEPPARSSWRENHLREGLGEPPSALSLLADWQTAPWLTRRVTDLHGSPWPLDPVAALGTVHRLWYPREREARLEVLKTGNRGPADAAARWARELTTPVRSHIDRLAVQSIGHLHERLDAITSRPEEDERATALELADRRDALESVIAILALGGLPHDTLALVRRLDREATSLWSQLPPAGVLYDVDWLAEVAVLSPLAWWAAFAVD